MNLELLKHAKGYIEKLANGINPLTGEIVPDNELINNIRISRCLFYVNEVLGEVYENGGINKSRGKRATIPFNITKEQLSNYQYDELDLPISQIVSKINYLVDNPNMKTLKTKDVCNWLVSLGILEEITKGNKKTKIPTNEGETLGMYLEHRFGYYGEYDIVMYKKETQAFIIDNIRSLLDFINK